MFRFKNLGMTEENPETLKSAFAEAEYFQEVRIGEAFLFYRTFLRTRYICIEEIAKAFLRVEIGESGDFPTQAIYLVLLRQDGKELRLHMDRTDTAKKMLSRLKEKHPGIECSVTK